MEFNLPSRIRGAIYILTAVGTPVVAYLLSKGFIGSLEAALWSNIVTAVGTMAALNISSDKK